MRNQRGITLIALVITIIVLLILAGVSIAMLTGDNGILTKSREAADDTAIANGKELAETDLQGYITDWYDAKYVNDPPTDQGLLDYVKAKFTTSSDTSMYTISGTTISIPNTSVTGEIKQGTTTTSVIIDWSDED